ncbi:MAG TPA: hypothetical protein H9812_07865 [Candidatus Gallimonas intestinigallinarum]|uniref:Uncharacterized protein n=1 Tax=Candidatus Gallimonas intestinigallinarum TaxID=2838604 RepID=A0A9D2DY11_9FIRM|nr:hypothetical protein [Candidatus Gallimonas intestinigallinarum]
MTESSLAQSLMMTNLVNWAQENLAPEQCAQLKAFIDRDYSEEAKALFESNREKLS